MKKKKKQITLALPSPEEVQRTKKLNRSLRIGKQIIKDIDDALYAKKQKERLTDMNTVNLADKNNETRFVYYDVDCNAAAVFFVKDNILKGDKSKAVHCVVEIQTDNGIIRKQLTPSVGISKRD
jgi:hypothetical protein